MSIRVGQILLIGSMVLYITKVPARLLRTISTSCQAPLMMMVWCICFLRCFQSSGIGKILFERIAFPIHIPSAEVDCIPTRNPLFSLGL